MDGEANQSVQGHEYLSPTPFIDSDQPNVVAFARQHDQGTDDRERSISLYRATRDGIRYNPFYVGRNPDYYRASACLQAGRGFCVAKAALLAACCRAVGIPARVGYADVRNHLSTPKLEELVGTNIYRWHGYTDILIDGVWVKATPAFDIALCDRLDVAALEFDGREDSLFQENNRGGDRFMEYVTERGVFADVPYDRIVADFAEHHSRWLDNRGD